jgi:ketosteroid isomerase-like protein
VTDQAQLEANKATVKEFILRLERGAVEEAFELFTPDGRWSGGGGAGDGFTNEEEVANIKWLFSKMKHGHLHFDHGEATAEGDRVAFAMRSYGEMVNDQVYNCLYHMLFWFRDGKISRCHEYAIQRGNADLRSFSDFPSVARSRMAAATG